MKRNLKAGGEIIKEMEKDATLCLVVILMRDSSRTVSLTDLENILGKTVKLIKENIKMV